MICPKPRFDSDYEQAIEDRKVADQEVEKLREEEGRLMNERERLLAAATKDKEIEWQSLRGSLRKALLNAEQRQIELEMVVATWFERLLEVLRIVLRESHTDGIVHFVTAGAPGRSDRRDQVGPPGCRHRCPYARLDDALRRGCDGVEPDNVDGYSNPNGVGLSASDQLDYNRFLADEAHARGLSIGLKNDLDQVEELEPWFDWALNEECLNWDECSLLRPFIDAGKAVFHVEYVDEQSAGPALAGEVCGVASISGFSTLIKTWDLDAWQIACE